MSPDVLGGASDLRNSARRNIGNIRTLAHWQREERRPSAAGPGTVTQPASHPLYGAAGGGGAGLELETKVRKVFTITEKAPTRAFSWLKVATTMFPVNNLSTRAFLVTLASATQFQFYLPWVHTCLALA